MKDLVVLIVMIISSVVLLVCMVDIQWLSTTPHYTLTLT